MRKKGRMLMNIVLSGLLLAGLFGCSKEEEVIDGPTSGDHIHEVDPDAPKTVASSNIISLDIALFLANRYYGDENSDFHFILQKSEDELYAIEEFSGVKEKADDALLNAIQKVIKDNDLASNNGVYDVTAGIAPDYQARRFFVEYDSGETIDFTMNNNPYAIWGEQLYDAFTNWLMSKGIDTLEPSLEDSVLTRVRFAFTEDGVKTEYSDLSITENGEKKLVLSKSLYNVRKDKTIKDKQRDFPQDYFEQMTRIIFDSGLLRNYAFSYYDHKDNNYGNHDEGYYGMGDKTTFDEEKDSEDLELMIHLVYASGKRINVDTKKASEIEGFRKLIEQIMEYHESLF